jgi:hypothetical protein
VNHELEKIRKEASVACFKLVSDICLQVLGKSVGSHDGGCSGGNSNPEPPSYEPLNRDVRFWRWNCCGLI